LQNQSQRSGDNLNNVKHETNRTFRNKKMECLKEKIELETNNMNRNIGHFIEAQTDLRRVTKTNSKG
jgi:t-SNARE complex subunit (syntaxin)